MKKLALCLATLALAGTTLLAACGGAAKNVKPTAEDADGGTTEPTGDNNAESQPSK